MAETARSVFPKQERMVSRRLIEMLFGGGGSQSMAAFPLRVVYLTRDRQPDEAPVQLLVSVPKKHFHHAVDRNRVKRQVREAYRRQKQLLLQSLPADRQLLMACVWLSAEHIPSADVDKKVASLMHRMAERL